MIFHTYGNSPTKHDSEDTNHPDSDLRVDLNKIRPIELMEYDEVGVVDSLAILLTLSINDFKLEDINNLDYIGVADD